MIYKNITKKILNGLVYIKGKFLKVTNKDFFEILKLLKESLMQKLDKKIDFKNIEKIKYLKLCYDKILLDTTNNIISNLKPCSICWVDFGQNIGSELKIKISENLDSRKKMIYNILTFNCCTS